MFLTKPTLLFTLEIECWLDNRTPFVFTPFRKQIRHPRFAVVFAEPRWFFKSKIRHLGAVDVFTRSVTNNDHTRFLVCCTKQARCRTWRAIRGAHRTPVRLTNIEISVFVNIPFWSVFRTKIGRLTWKFITRLYITPVRFAFAHFFVLHTGFFVSPAPPIRLLTWKVKDGLTRARNTKDHPIRWNNFYFFI